jgi:phosphoribosylformimino-5-aminoimidazole carboxamide ribotide isomerase
VNSPAFTLYPAIDLKDGQCVRLYKGAMDQATVFNDNPAAQALSFQDAGAQWLHVVDLNGAFAGASVNGEAVRGILAALTIPVQLGGGIRSLAHIEAWLNAGISRVILGTIALTNPALVIEACQTFPGKIVVGIDARDGFVATEGWAETSSVSVTELAARFEGAGVSAIIYTDIGRDGTLMGVNIEATAALAKASSLPIIASGGVAGMADIDALLPHQKDGIEGVICGRALYDGRLDLAHALQKITENHEC